MGLFSFRKGEKGKIKKMLEEGRIDEVLRKASKNKKTADSLIELLEDENPGTVGDALMVISNMVKEGDSTVVVDEKLVRKALELLTSKVTYVREGAMALSMEIAKRYGDKHREEFSKGIERLLDEGDVNQVAFALLLIKELKLIQFKDRVEQLVNIDEKVMLPFEGRRWVKLGDIAKEVLSSL